MPYMNYSALQGANQESSKTPQNWSKNCNNSTHSLGNNAKSSTPHHRAVSEDVQKSDQDNKKLVQQTRATRYLLQNVARNILYNEGKKHDLQYPHNFNQTIKCKHIRIDSMVGVHQSKEFQKAFYSGVVTCGRVWSCPVCAPKIQERRRIEIAKAFEHAYSINKQVAMVTLTFPHTVKMTLKDSIEKQRLALKYFRSGKKFTEIKKTIGFSHLIRSLEVTYGKNGWHPHTHEAWIIDEHQGEGYTTYLIKQKWLNACERAGLIDLTKGEKVSQFLEHSVDIKYHCHASDYLAKQDDSKNWGADRELAKATSKNSNKTEHPFNLLQKISDGEDKKKNIALFLEYVEGMKGARQLYWSPGLKDLVGIKDKSDEEIAEEESDNADLLANLTPEQWDEVKKHKAQAIILDLAENEGSKGIYAWFKKEKVFNRIHHRMDQFIQKNPTSKQEISDFIDQLEKDITDQDIDDYFEMRMNEIFLLIHRLE